MLCNDKFASFYFIASFSAGTWSLSPHSVPESDFGYVHETNVFPSCDDLRCVQIAVLIAHYSEHLERRVSAFIQLTIL